MTLLHRLSAFICAGSLMSCAGHSKKKTDDEPAGARVKAPDRIAIDSLKRAQEGKLSPMDKKVAGASKAFGTDKKEFKTNAFTSGKTFQTGKGEFKTETFSQGNKQTRDGSMTFQSGKGDNLMEGKTFATSQNALESKKSMDGARMFSGSGTIFPTKENYTSEKALKESRKPTVVGAQEAYSEEQVRRLLNKQ
jgi:hypothetical protein